MGREGSAGMATSKGPGFHHLVKRGEEPSHSKTPKTCKCHEGSARALCSRAISLPLFLVGFHTHS